ncbi:DUF2314 domain-containing protein [Geothrix edaphica]|jgi:uncharacterized protein YegJ (DUF2314 family)|uniref:DUF2314 domain-containing protein n=1 Tax=Geothrix edaphica TaxID=2927976 RepID=UPI0025523435|nr:DUF2314 domain-containing protein [Geothrix edaphica]
MTHFIYPLIGLTALFIWWRFFRISRPDLPPLFMEPDDPLMSEAMQKAVASIPQFLDLVDQPNNGVRVKVPFISSSGEKEFLWAEMLGLENSQMSVRYLTPPITHTGRLERIHTHSISELVDWQVESPSGSYTGGFTMRVMFVRGREQWGHLPPQLEIEEQKYV